MNKNKIKIINIGILIAAIFTISVIQTNQNRNTITTNIGAISNKKIGWGIKRNDKHEQPDVGSINKKILEENGGICLGNKERQVFF